MRNGWLAAGVLLAVTGGLTAQVIAQGAAPGAAPGAGVVTQRQEEMKANQRLLEASKAVLDSRGDVTTLAPRAAEMRGYFANLPALFPAGTETVGNTKALPAVWSDRAGFERASANATTAAEALQTAAASGDAAATATAFQAMGGACGGCHRNYRART